MPRVEMAESMAPIAPWTLFQSAKGLAQLCAAASKPSAARGLYTQSIAIGVAVLGRRHQGGVHNLSRHRDVALRVQPPVEALQGQVGAAGINANDEEAPAGLI